MTDLSQIAEQEWNEAHRRAAVLRPLLELKPCPREKAREAAAELGLSDRQVYRLILRLRESGDELTTLLPGGSNGGQGKPRLAAPRENLLQRLIAEIYVTRQKRSPADLVLAIRSQSLKAGLDPPSESTIRRRLKTLSLAERCQRGEQHPEAKPIYGVTPASDTPLDWLQVDHTPVDLIIVDPIERLPIGRPWITVAIDVFSRCIAGFHLSLEAPSATSVGLCLTMVATDKAQWLQQRGIEARWPTVGKPHRVGVDNGTEFHSAAFERGCAQHGIAIEWRPPGLPHFGGVVERVIGTLMQLVHALPGTTFSNPAMRGGYDSEHLLASPEFAHVQGQRILIVRGGGGRELLAEQLTARGAEVAYAEVYDRRCAVPIPGAVAAVEAEWSRGEIQVITATSGELLRCLFEILSPDGRDLLARSVFVIDKQGKIDYQQIVAELTKEPDYDAVLAAAKKAVTK